MKRIFVVKKRIHSTSEIATSYIVPHAVITTGQQVTTSAVQLAGGRGEPRIGSIEILSKGVMSRSRVDALSELCSHS